MQLSNPAADKIVESSYNRPSKQRLYQLSNLCECVTTCDEKTDLDPALNMDPAVDMDTDVSEYNIIHNPSIDASVLIEEPVQCDDTTEPLFSCSSLSCFQAILELVSWFSNHAGISKNAFSQLLNILHTKILPQNNILPTSYAEAMAILKPYLTPVKEYHCCINDCVVFRNSETQSYNYLNVQYVERVGSSLTLMYHKKHLSIYL